MAISTLHAAWLEDNRRKSNGENTFAALEITLKSAWFLSMRIREAMRNDDFSPMGGAGGIVEIDETFVGTNDKARARRAFGVVSSFPTNPSTQHYPASCQPAGALVCRSHLPAI